MFTKINIPMGNQFEQKKRKKIQRVDFTERLETHLNKALTYMFVKAPKISFPIICVEQGSHTCKN